METGIPAAAGCTIPANVIPRSTGSISAGENHSSGKSLPSPWLASELEKQISKRGHDSEKTKTTRYQQILCYLPRFAPFPSHRCGSKKPQRPKLDGTRSAGCSLHVGHLPMSSEATHGHHFGKSVRQHDLIFTREDNR